MKFLLIFFVLWIPAVCLGKKICSQHIRIYIEQKNQQQYVCAYYEDEKNQWNLVRKKSYSQDAINQYSKSLKLPKTKLGFPNEDLPTPFVHLESLLETLSEVKRVANKKSSSTLDLSLASYQKFLQRASFGVVFGGLLKVSSHLFPDIFSFHEVSEFLMPDKYRMSEEFANTTIFPIALTYPFFRKIDPLRKKTEGQIREKFFGSERKLLCTISSEFRKIEGDYLKLTGLSKKQMKNNVAHLSMVLNLTLIRDKSSINFICPTSAPKTC